MVIASLLLYSTQLSGPLDYKSKMVVKSIFKRAARPICSVNCIGNLLVKTISRDFTNKET